MLWRIITPLFAQYLWRVVLTAYQIFNLRLMQIRANSNQRRFYEKKYAPKNRIFPPQMAVFCRWIYQRWQRVCSALVSSLFHYSVGLKMSDELREAAWAAEKAAVAAAWTAEKAVGDAMAFALAVRDAAVAATWTAEKAAWETANVAKAAWAAVDAADAARARGEK
jgi:hypothetical protein